MEQQQTNPLKGMTWDTWKRMPEEEREKLRDYSGLSDQLKGLEGWRVEVVDDEGTKPRRFIVGRSTGWRPCHIEVQTRRSHGGIAAQSPYFSVRKLEKVR